MTAPSVHDVVVIGGGVTGAGIARDLSLRGLSVLLLEKGDWGAGTSGALTTTLLLSAPTAMTFYQGIKMPHADNCFLYRRSK